MTCLYTPGDRESYLEYLRKSCSFQIARAVGAHQPARARKLMVDHISKAEDRIVAALRAAGY